MPSPFPGMDPYLEGMWRDVHARFIVYASEALQAALPSGLRARIEERVVLEEPPMGQRSVIPDIRVVESPRTRRKMPRGATTVEFAEPVVVGAMDHEPGTETFIEIIDITSGNRVVCVIELLSPTNQRPGDGMDQYLRKQRELLRSRANLVEINLTRDGRHVLAVPLSSMRPELRSPYMVCAHRGTNPNQFEVYPIHLDASLPVIRVPLRPTDDDVPLDLQAVLAKCYEAGQYELDIDYRKDPKPPLSGPAAKWADALLRKAGLRKRPRRSRKNR